MVTSLHNTLFNAYCGQVSTKQSQKIYDYVWNVALMKYLFEAWCTDHWLKT